MSEEITGRRGWLYWLVAVLALVWNGFACFDFVMIITRNVAYLSQYPRDVIDWYDSAPTWTALPWALAVWAGLAGAVSILLRSRRAVTAFALSLVGLAAIQAWVFSAGLPQGFRSGTSIQGIVMTWVIALGLLWFAAHNTPFSRVLSGGSGARTYRPRPD